LENIYPIERSCLIFKTNGLDILKEKMAIKPIFVFPDWLKEFHVHVDSSPIALGVVLT
jgi:hypothetical protein